MPKGTIKFYNTKKKFGFITQEEGEDLFFHISSVVGEPKVITAEQPVSFEIGEGKKGPEAKQITIEGEAPQKAQKPKKPKEKKKNAGDLYMDKQIRLETPMVFETYAQSIPCVVKKNLTYDIDLLCDGEVQQIKFTDVKYCYKQRDEDKVKADIQFDEEVKAQKLEPIIPRKERYQIQNELLKKARKEKKTIRLVLRGGEIFIGTIDWFTRYEIKMILPSGGKVVTFRHAAYDFSILGEEKQKEKEEEVSIVKITKEQAEKGTLVTISTPDGNKVAVRLPAGVADGQRFRIKNYDIRGMVKIEG